MSRRRVIPPPDPIAASSLCQVVTGDNAGCRSDALCDCVHTTRLGSGTHRGRPVEVRATWYVSVDAFSGIAVTYFPVIDPETGHELITEPELARLL